MSAGDPLHAAGLEVEHHFWSDNYIGARDKLVAAGFASTGEFPGDPGRGKAVAIFGPDGTYSPNRRRSVLGCGARRITLATKGRFCVSVRVSDEESKRRLANRERSAGKATEPAGADEHEKLLLACLATLFAAWGVDGTAARVEGVRRTSVAAALSGMGVLHRRNLPAGWRVIEGQRAT